MRLACSACAGHVLYGCSPDRYLEILWVTSAYLQLRHTCVLGNLRGFGTVRFATKEDAVQACEKMNNSQIDGRTISVRIDRFA